MSPNKYAVPDAWDDDWESQADKAEAAAASPSAPPEEPAKVSKAERLAKHAEQNKQLWDSAQTPETFHYLAAQNAPPLRTEFKPALKVLARKPAPKTIKIQDPVTGIERLVVQNDDEDEEDMKRNVVTAEERKVQAQKEREEKQRKYEEVRARLFGTDGLNNGGGKGSASGTSSPGSGEEGRGGRGRGRGRGGRGNADRQDARRPEGRGEPQGTRELFDPNHTPKPGSVMLQRRGDSGPSSGRSTPKADEQIIRTPRGPDSSGRGGFGFANRGEKAG